MGRLWPEEVEGGVIRGIARRANRQEGFTLVEVLFVVLFIGILMGIAIPSYLVHRQGTQDRATQQQLRNALLAAKIEFVDPESYVGIDSAELNALEVNMTFVAANQPSTASRVVSVDPVSAKVWYAAARSDSGMCFAVKDDIDPGQGTTYAKFSNGTCTAQHAEAVGVFSKDGW
jgi:prepilin-type N-terminal cleavage/methylation domain-containing protein